MRKRLTQSRWARLILLAGVLLALMTTYASAQGMPPISLRPPERTLTPEERERQKQIDDDYKAANKKVPDQKAKDPWADVRSGPTITNPKKKQK